MCYVPNGDRLLRYDHLSDGAFSIHYNLHVVDSRCYFPTLSVGTVPERFLITRCLVLQLLDRYIAERVIQQNIAFAIGEKVLFLGLAAGGVATLWMAIAADMGASLLVIFNGLRLLKK